MIDNTLLDINQYTVQLKQWVEEVVRGKRWEHLDDLHIDTLGGQFRRPGRWIEGSLLLLGALTTMYDPQLYQTLLVIPLTSTAVPTDIQELDSVLLEKEVDTTPPSFYLFPQPSPVVTATMQKTVYLPKLSQQLQQQVYFREQLDEGEYERSLMVLAAMPIKTEEFC